MADKVVRLSGACSIAAGAVTSEGKVILQMTGRADGRAVRVELALESWDVESVVHVLRGAVKLHKERWDAVTVAVGEP